MFTRGPLFPRKRKNRHSRRKRHIVIPAKASHRYSRASGKIVIPGASDILSFLRKRHIVIPAQAGIHWLFDGRKMDPRFRGDDESIG
jgi:hypothetical protein